MTVKGLEIEESDRQLTIRALAVQSLESPGFTQASRAIAMKLGGGGMFDDFRRSLQDKFPPEGIR